MALLQRRPRWPCYSGVPEGLVIQKGQMDLLYRKARWLYYARGPDGLIQKRADGRVAIQNGQMAALLCRRAIWPLLGLVMQKGQMTLLYRRARWPCTGRSDGLVIQKGQVTM